MRLESNFRKGLLTKEKFIAGTESLGLKQKFFDILVEGEFPLYKIETLVTQPGDVLKRTPQSERILDRAWNEHVAAGNRPWPNDLKPTRYHLADFEVTDSGALQITLDPSVSYRDFVGSRESDLLAGPPENIPNPIAVSTVLIAKNAAGEDGVLLTVRKSMHDYKPGGYHVLGGFMDIRKDAGPTDTALRESAEECGLTPEEITELKCHGLVLNKIEGHVDAVYSARTSVLAEDILTRMNDGENEVIFIPLSAAKLREWVIVPTHANVVITSAALLMVGKSFLAHELGQNGVEAWHRDMLAMLAYRSRDYGDKEIEQALEQRDLKRLRVKVDVLRRNS